MYAIVVDWRRICTITLERGVREPEQIVAGGCQRHAPQVGLCLCRIPMNCKNRKSHIDDMIHYNSRIFAEKFLYECNAGVLVIDDFTSYRSPIAKESWLVTLMDSHKCIKF